MSKSLKLRELLARLRDFGVVEHPNPARGKGSETVVYKPSEPGSLKGPIFTLPGHGKGTEVSAGLVRACLRRFGIDKDEFFRGA